MKLIFLDYDGVLNKIVLGNSTPIKMVGDLMTQADPELVYRLNLLVDRTGAELVLSSAWRHQKEWREIMRASGIVKEFLGRTTKYSSCTKYKLIEARLCRGHNIQDWLDEHKVDKYAILDDEANMLQSQQSNFFKTNTVSGLTQDIADEVEKHLGLLPEVTIPVIPNTET